jgi:hypothetical protein
MINGQIDRIDSRTIKRDQFHWLDFHSATLIKNLHALHLDEWCFQKDKSVSLKILRKVSFQLWGAQSGPLGRMVCGPLKFI